MINLKCNVCISNSVQFFFRLIEAFKVLSCLIKQLERSIDDLQVHRASIRRVPITAE